MTINSSRERNGEEQDGMMMKVARREEEGRMGRRIRRQGRTREEREEDNSSRERNGDQDGMIKWNKEEGERMDETKKAKMNKRGTRKQGREEWRTGR